MQVSPISHSLVKSMHMYHLGVEMGLLKLRFHANLRHALQISIKRTVIVTVALKIIVHLQVPPLVVPVGPARQALVFLIH